MRRISSLVTSVTIENPQGRRLSLINDHRVVPVQYTLWHFIINFKIARSKSSRTCLVLSLQRQFIAARAYSFHMPSVPLVVLATCCCVPTDEPPATATSEFEWLLRRWVSLNHHSRLSRFVCLVSLRKAWYWSFRHSPSQVVESSFDVASLQLLVALIVVFNPALRLSDQAAFSAWRIDDILLLQWTSANSFHGKILMCPCILWRLILWR